MRARDRILCIHLLYYSAVKVNHFMHRSIWGAEACWLYFSHVSERFCLNRPQSVACISAWPICQEITMVQHTLLLIMIRDLQNEPPPLLLTVWCFVGASLSPLLATTPSTVMYKSLQPWAKSCDVFWPCRVPLNWLLCLESQRSRGIPHASKPAGEKDRSEHLD